jgi:ribosomal protein L24E
MMSEKCKNCEKEFDSGIWLAPQFNDEKVLLFCSDKCKKIYLKRKLRGIKDEYPKYYERIKGGKVESIFEGALKNEKI